VNVVSASEPMRVDNQGEASGMTSVVIGGGSAIVQVEAAAGDVLTVAVTSLGCIDRDRH
jgi:hypothetical protein